MNDNILVTIGLPFYNTKKYLDFSIQSIINQTYENWELILTDDGSTDNSLEIVKKYLFDSRITLISDNENKGLPFRLNQQINLAKGKYFARMDADDIMHPERILRQVEYLEANLYIDVVGSYAYSIDVNNNICGILIPNINPKTINDVFNHKCFIHPSVMARLDWYKNNLYDMKQIRIEDTELWARTILYSNFANLNIPLLFYRDVGISYLKKYLQSTKGERLLIRNSFSKYMFLQKWQLIIKSYIKSMLYIIFFIFHQEKILIRRRSSIISDIEKQNAVKILKLAII